MTENVKNILKPIQMILELLYINSNQKSRWGKFSIYFLIFFSCVNYVGACIYIGLHINDVIKLGYTVAIMSSNVQV